MTPDTTHTGNIPQTPAEKLQFLEDYHRLPNKEARERFLRDKGVRAHTMGMWNRRFTIEGFEKRAGRLVEEHVLKRTEEEIRQARKGIKAALERKKCAKGGYGGNGHTNEAVTTSASSSEHEENAPLSEQEEQELAELLELLKPISEDPNLVEIVDRRRAVRLAYLVHKKGAVSYEQWCREMNLTDVLHEWRKQFNQHESVTHPPAPANKPTRDTTPGSGDGAARRNNRPHPYQERTRTDDSSGQPEMMYEISSGETPPWLVDTVPNREADPATQEGEATRASDVLRNLGFVIGNDPEMNKVLSQAQQAARSHGHVLVLGESGTGKELVAQAIGRLHNPNGTVYAVNCANLNSNLIQSELFGHVRGAFTDAKETRLGAFALVAGEGTLFLDEIGDLPLDQQAVLLRVLEERKFTPVGTSEPVKLQNTKIVAATNQDLPTLIKLGRFRGDLYQRLTGSTIRVPPLAPRTPQHKQDLVGVILQRLEVHYKTKIYMTADALGYIQAQPYPGNVRELSNHIDRVVGAATPVNNALYITREGLQNTCLSTEEMSPRNSDERTSTIHTTFFNGTIDID